MDAICLENLETLPLDSSCVLYALKQKSWDRLLAARLPTKRTNGFRHLSLQTLYGLTLVASQTAAVTKDEIASLILPSCKKSHIVFVNGKLSLDLSDVSGLQIQVSSLEEGFSSHFAFLQARFEEFIAKEADPFALLNFSMQSQGAFIRVPSDVKAKAPLQVLHFLKGDKQQMVAPHIQVAVGKRSEVSLVVTSHVSGGTHVHLPHLDLFCDQESKCHVSEALHGEFVMSAFRAKLRKNAHLERVELGRGGKAHRSSFHVKLAEEGAKVELNGLMDLQGSSAHHIYGTIEHNAPETESMQSFKSVLRDTSRCSYSGKIKVDSIAQKTDAYQLHNTLLLSPHAVAISEPNLEIEADDVKASHGATISEVKAEDLFYCKARGIEESVARELLIEAFTNPILEKLHPELI